MSAAVKGGARLLLDLLKGSNFELQVHKLSAIRPFIEKGKKVVKGSSRFAKKSGAPGLEVMIEGRKTPVFIHMDELKREVPALRRHFQRSGRRGATGLESENLGFREQRGILGTAGHKIGESFRRRPLSSGVNALLVGSILSELVGEPLIGAAQQSLTGENFLHPERSFSNILQRQKMLQTQQRSREAEVLQLQRLMSQNMARLASASPHLYNQVMAGRQLPEGGVVIGGQPRQDLMEMLAYDMATGALGSQQTPEQQMLAAMAQ